MRTYKANRQQMTEAIMLFGEKGIVAEMLYPEFEAVLDNVVSMPERAGQQVRAAYVVINPRLQVRTVVLFFLDFDDQGRADPGWNIPLRQLVDKAEHGPDLGEGPIRFVCRSQTPVPWLQMHLWDPELSPGHNHLQMIRDAVRRNQLRLLVEDEPVAPVGLERLHVADEDSWQLPGATPVEVAPVVDRRDLEQRRKAASQIRELRLQVRTLEAEHTRSLAELRQLTEQRLLREKASLDEVTRAMALQQERNESLQKQVEQLTTIGIDAKQQLKNLAGLERTQLANLKAQMEDELRAHKKFYETARQQQDVAHANSLAQAEQQLLQLRQQLAAAVQDNKRLSVAAASGESVLQRLDDEGVSLVTIQPGAGHITIPVDEVDDFLASPQAYAARYCMVSEADYKIWLKHYESPACDATIPVTGELCGLPLERKTHPSRFTQGISNRCSRHRELW